MTVLFDPTASDSTRHHGNPVLECGGARMRAQCRHLATVVTVSGVIDGTNVDAVRDYSRRFILPDKPFILDLCGVDLLATQDSQFLYRIDEGCRTAGVEWALVPSPAVTRVLPVGDDDATLPVAASVHEALHYFADDISARRRLLLPLLGKTA